jgi:hypothetical protein
MICASRFRRLADAAVFDGWSEEAVRRRRQGGG